MCKIVLPDDYTEHVTACCVIGSVVETNILFCYLTDLCFAQGQVTWLTVETMTFMLHERLISCRMADLW